MLRLVPVHARDRFADAFQRSFLGFLRGQILLMMFLALASYFAICALGSQLCSFSGINCRDCGCNPWHWGNVRSAVDLDFGVGLSRLARLL